MKKHHHLTLTLYLLSCVCIVNANERESNLITNNKSTMDKIKFTPKEFNKIEYGYFQSSSNACTPSAGDSYSFIKINVPREVIYYSKNSVKTTNMLSIDPLLPICTSEMYAYKRISKYYNLVDLTFHIKKADSDKWHSGILTPSDPPREGSYDYRELTDEEKLNIQNQIKEAQYYHDDEIDTGNASGRVMNLNLHEYVQIILEEGEYEIYLSKSGLESNHVIVKITFK